MRRVLRETSVSCYGVLGPPGIRGTPTVHADHQQRSFRLRAQHAHCVRYQFRIKSKSQCQTATSGGVVSLSGISLMAIPVGTLTQQ